MGSRMEQDGAWRRGLLAAFGATFSPHPHAPKAALLTRHHKGGTHVFSEGRVSGLWEGTGKESGDLGSVPGSA